MDSAIKRRMDETVSVINEGGDKGTESLMPMSVLDTQSPLKTIEKSPSPPP